MRRRRRSNNTLWKTMGIAVLITAAILPIMAWLGVFKAVKQKYYSVTMVTLPPPKPLPKAAQPHHKKVASKSHANAHSNERRQQAKSTKPLPFHVAAAAPSGNGTGPSVVNGTNTDIGAAPASPPPAQNQTAQAPITTPPPTTAPVTPTPAPVAPVQPVTPPASTVVDAQVVSDPKPSIPDDLLGSDLNTNFWAIFTIHPDGTTDVKMIQSTGNQELDSIALQCARQWKFRPATKDGQPVESYERLQVEFQVS